MDMKPSAYRPCAERGCMGSANHGKWSCHWRVLPDESIELWETGTPPHKRDVYGHKDGSYG